MKQSIVNNNTFFGKIQLVTILLLLFVGTLSNAQSWQWLKAGGNADSGSGPDYTAKVQYMDSDPAGNVYAGFKQVIQSDDIAPRTFTVAGTAVATYSIYDDVIASFSCDGALRWTVTIGGSYVAGSFGGYTTLHGTEIKGLNVDNQGNVYVTGNFRRIGIPSIPFHFDPNFTLPNSPANNVHKETFFIAKYNNNGVCQWVRLPEGPNVVVNEPPGRCYAQKMVVDPNGTIHIDSFFYPGVFCNGALTITGTPDLLQRGILKYDSNGNYIGYAPVDLKDITYSTYHFLHDPNLNRYYFSRIIYYPDFPVFIGGQPQTKSIYVACYSSTGTFLWKKEDENPNLYSSFEPSTFGLTLDNQSNIYLNCLMSQIYDANIEPTNIPNGWNGQPIIFPPDWIIQQPALCVIIKMDSNGNTLWMKNTTNPESGSTMNSSIINGDELGIITGFSRFAYEGIPDMTEVANGGAHALLRINKNTGVGIGLHQLYVDVNNTFAPSAIARGPNGGFYMGGAFESSISINASGTPATINTGGFDDFYIAKFGTSNCSLATTKNTSATIATYPNPAVAIVYVANKVMINYILYDALGKMVQMDTLPPNGSIAIDHLNQGIYLLQMKDEQGNISTQKIVKE